MATKSLGQLLGWAMLSYDGLASNGNINSYIGEPFWLMLATLELDLGLNDHWP